MPFLTAQENVAIPLVLDGVKNREIDERVQSVLELVGMSHRAAHKPSQLSGGEQQRIAVARALVINPAIVLADEPTGNLDSATGRSIMDLIQDINERMRVTILLVTHDAVFASRATRIMRLIDGAMDQEISIEARAKSRKPEVKIVS